MSIMIGKGSSGNLPVMATLLIMPLSMRSSGAPSRRTHSLRKASRSPKQILERSRRRTNSPDNQIGSLRSSCWEQLDSGERRTRVAKSVIIGAEDPAGSLGSRLTWVRFPEEHLSDTCGQVKPLLSVFRRKSKGFGGRGVTKHLHS